MVVVAELGVVIVDVPGFPACADHVPLPVADIVVVPPGSIAQLTVLSVPASGFAVTVIFAVSVHPLAFVQIKL